MYEWMQCEYGLREDDNKSISYREDLNHMNGCSCLMWEFIFIELDKGWRSMSELDFYSKRL